MKKTVSRSKIKNIGKALRSLSPHQKVKDEDLEILNLWRRLHEPSLKYFTSLIQMQAAAISIDKSERSVTQRLKRVHSIILKLKRFEHMQLSMMDDIAGARIVLPTTSEVNRLTDSLKERKKDYQLLKINNYISIPKDDGYRSIHLVYKVEKDLGFLLEIQIRSHLQHVWATAVEVFGTLESTSFKTGEGNREWRDFFALLSSRFAIEEGTPIVKEHEVYSRSQLEKLLIQKIKGLNVIEQLNALTATYSSKWRKHRKRGRGGKYALITLNTADSTTRVQLFAESRLDEALKEYASIEQVHHSSQVINVVLVNIDNMDNLEAAYPNYFMDTKKLTQYLSEIVLGRFSR